MAEHEHHNEQKTTANPSRRMLVRVTAAIVAVVLIVGIVFWYVSSKSVYIDQSVIQAPLIKLSPSTSGILESVFVKEGDMVTANQPVARVGDEIVKAKTNGQIVSVANNIGEYINAFTGQGAVATMIDPGSLRVVGHLEETKGLVDVKVGNPATFTVDAFGSKAYEGVVDEVSPTSRQSDIVFNISDQRPTNEFDIKVRFDPQKYPELKNGMSARIWAYKE